MKMMRFVLGTLGAGWLVMSVCLVAEAAAPAAKSIELFPDKVLAKGKGVEVKQSEVEAEFLAYKMEVAVSGGEVPEAKRAEIEKKILDRLIVSRILMNNATDADKDKAKESVDRFITRTKAQAGSEEAFTRQIEARGLTTDEFRRKLMERAIAEEVYNREVKSKVVVNEAEMKKFYDENPDKFQQPELVKAQHLLKLTVDPKLSGVPNANPELSADQKKLKLKETEALLKRVRDGEDFGKLVKENSEDPSVGQNNGEYTFARKQMAPEFETAAFALSVNQVSDVVTTKAGYHLIKVLEKTPAQKLQYEKVKDKIHDYLLQQESDKQVPAYTEKVKKDAEVEFLSK